MNRLTILSKNNVYGLSKVKENEQEIQSKHPNTLKAVLESWERLGEYENTGLIPEQVVNLQIENEALRTAANSYKAKLKEQEAITARTYQNGLLEQAELKKLVPKDGEWVDGNGFVPTRICSVCSTEYGYVASQRIGEEITFNTLNHCPNCGANMKGDDKC